MKSLIFWIFGLFKKPKDWRVRWVISFSSVTLEGFDMALVLPYDRVVTLSLNPTDAQGNSAALDGVPVWSTTDSNAIMVVPSEDGLSAVLQPTGAIFGTFQVSVIADARFGPEVVELVGLLDVQIVGGEAVSLNLAVSELRPK